MLGWSIVNRSPGVGSQSTPPWLRLRASSTVIMGRAYDAEVCRAAGRTRGIPRSVVTSQEVEGPQLVLGHQARADEETHALRRLDGEAAASPSDHVDGEVGVLPVGILRQRHPE